MGICSDRVCVYSISSSSRQLVGGRSLLFSLEMSAAKDKVSSQIL